MNVTPREDLDWLAFRYLAAELSPAESLRFESRLEHDQQAREAVGRLVETTCAVRSLDWDVASRAMPVRRRRPWYRRRAAQVVTGLAVGLMVALLVWGPDRARQQREPEGRFAKVPPAAELAVVWSHVRTELSTQRVEEAAGWRWLASAEGETGAADSTDEEDAPDAPDWMVSAVVAMESQEEAQRTPAANIEGI